MATIDRLEPAYVPWSPSASGFVTEDTANTEYVGKHRARAARRFGMRRLFYVARHARR